MKGRKRFMNNNFRITNNKNINITKKGHEEISNEELKIPLFDSSNSSSNKNDIIINIENENPKFSFDIPNEISENIIKYLSPKEILNFASTNKKHRENRNYLPMKSRLTIEYPISVDSVKTIWCFDRMDLFLTHEEKNELTNKFQILEQKSQFLTEVGIHLPTYLHLNKKERLNYERDALANAKIIENKTIPLGSKTNQNLFTIGVITSIPYSSVLLQSAPDFFYFGHITAASFGCVLLNKTIHYFNPPTIKPLPKVKE
jgi:hypothetical protein